MLARCSELTMLMPDLVRWSLQESCARATSRCRQCCQDQAAERHLGSYGSGFALDGGFQYIVLSTDVLHALSHSPCPFDPSQD